MSEGTVVENGSKEIKHSSSPDKHKSSHKSSHRDKHGHRSSSSHHKSSKHKSSKHESSSSSRHHHGSSSSSHHKSSKHRSSSGHHHSSSKDDKHRSSGHHHSSSHRSSGEVKSLKIEDIQATPLISENGATSPAAINNPWRPEQPVANGAAGDGTAVKSEQAAAAPATTLISETTSNEMLHPDTFVKVEMEPEDIKIHIKRERKDSTSEDEMPLNKRKELKKEIKMEQVKLEIKKEISPKKKTPIKTEIKVAIKRPGGKNDGSPQKKTKKQIEEEEMAANKWRWWEEDRKTDGSKWRFLEHQGPMFAPEYDSLPKDARGWFMYDGQYMHLSRESEEVAGFYARMLDHDFTTRDVFNNNFFKDWRKVMTAEERTIITNVKLCNFKKMHTYFLQQTEKRKQRTKDEKLELKQANEKLVEIYGFCKMDGHTEKIGNFRIEPPGLFRGRGDHPKQGRLKTRTVPSEVIINCSKDSEAPAPPPGTKWKEVRHDNQVSWLACWTENIQGSVKYVMLNAGSKIKGEKDWMKYEVARKLHNNVDKIRQGYINDWKSKEMRTRQRATALYFIDKLALRAGNEKDDSEQADTVGCCSLRVEHLKLHEQLDEKDWVVEFDFLGKDSIRYYNAVSVEKRVFKNLIMFTDNKSPSDDVFDRLNTLILNKHLQTLMDGLTAKVFRTYNASITLQQQLNLLTKDEDVLPAKVLSYNRANRAVAVLCNHQRAVSKNFSKQMEGMQEKIALKKESIQEAKVDLKSLKSQAKCAKTSGSIVAVDKKKKQIEKLDLQLAKLEVSLTDKDENKDIALGTSKLNYLDPRISVAWCKKYDVPLEKVYSKTQRDKFAWAIDMADSDFVF